MGVPVVQFQNRESICDRVVRVHAVCEDRHETNRVIPAVRNDDLVCPWIVGSFDGPSHREERSAIRCPLVYGFHELPGIWRDRQSRKRPQAGFGNPTRRCHVKGDIPPHGGSERCGTSDDRADSAVLLLPEQATTWLRVDHHRAERKNTPPHGQNVEDRDVPNSRGYVISGVRGGCLYDVLAIGRGRGVPLYCINGTTR